MNIRVVNLNRILCVQLCLPEIVFDMDFMVYINGWRGFCYKKDLQKCIMLGLNRI